jgi:hypothetical protein
MVEQTVVFSGVLSVKLPNRRLDIAPLFFSGTDGLRIGYRGKRSDQSEKTAPVRCCRELLVALVGIGA